jgi:hypothetical protein
MIITTPTTRTVVFDAVTESGKSLSCEITFHWVYSEPGSAGIVGGWEYDSAYFAHHVGSVELTNEETDELIEQARRLL